MDYLNKKEWHTGSIKNIAKVWQREQEESRKIQKQEEYKKKLQEEQHAHELKVAQVEAGLIPKSALEKMDWMYNPILGQTPQDTEQYLLGKQVDLNNLPSAQQKNQQDPQDNSNKYQAIVTEDVTNSTCENFTLIHEDPLFKMMQEEQKMKEKLMNNPLDMNLLMEELRKQKEFTKLANGISKKDKKKKDKKDKKSKKDKKNRHKDEKEGKKKKNKQRSRSRSSRKDKKEKDSKHKKDKKQRKSRSSSSSGSESSSRSVSPSNSRERKNKRSRSRSENNKKRRENNGRSHSPHRNQKENGSSRNNKDKKSRKSRSDSSSQSISKERKTKRSRSRSETKKLREERQRSLSPESKIKQMHYEEYLKKKVGNILVRGDDGVLRPDFGLMKRKFRNNLKPEEKLKMTEEEKKERLKEMQENAKELTSERLKEFKDDYQDGDNNTDESKIKDLHGKQNNPKFLQNMNKDIYTGKKDLNALADQLSMNKNRLTRNLEEKNTFK